MSDIRYKQRFQNFYSAFNLLNSELENRGIKDFSDLELEGLAQRFEYTFELGWKLFKDYLEYNEVYLEETFPRKVIKECANIGIFTKANMNPEIYLDMLSSRNKLSHLYDNEEFTKVMYKVKDTYIIELKKQVAFFMKLTNE